jgi:hypothetical protein
MAPIAKPKAHSPSKQLGHLKADQKLTRFFHTHLQSSINMTNCQHNPLFFISLFLNGVQGLRYNCALINDSLN